MQLFRSTTIAIPDGNPIALTAKNAEELAGRVRELLHGHRLAIAGPGYFFASDRYLSSVTVETLPGRLSSRPAGLRMVVRRHDESGPGVAMAGLTHLCHPRLTFHPVGLSIDSDCGRREIAIAD